MNKAARIALMVFGLLLLLVVGYIGVMVISHGPPSYNWSLVVIYVGSAVVAAFYCAWLLLFKIIDTARKPIDGPFGRTAPLDEVWGRTKK